MRRAAVADLVAATAATWRLSAGAVDETAAELAAAAGMVVLDGTGPQRVIRAAHPLWSAAAYASLPGARRRALHQRLAAAADDPVERVRHAALGATAPSAALAEELDAGVGAAVAAGVPDIAAALAHLAVEHTLDPGLRPARLDRLADAQFRAGDTAGALGTQRAAVAATAPGPERARRRVRLAEYAIEGTGWDDAERELGEAVLEAAGDRQIQAEALMTLSAVTDDIELGAASAAQALALLESDPEPDPALLAGALAQVAGTRFRAGEGLDHGLFDRAVEIERAHPFRRLSDRADTSYAVLLKYADDLAGSERLLLQLRAEADGIGDLSSIAYVIGHLSQIRLWQGRVLEGRALADEQLAMAAHNEQSHYNLGQAMAYQGELEGAESVLRELLADPSVGEWTAHRVAATLGFVALSRDDAVTAAVHLDRWYEALRAMHFGEPGYSRSHLDRLSALVGSGRTADAATFRDELDDQATRSGRRSAAAVALTGSAMLDAQAGRLDDARAGVATALAWYDASPLRFDRARTLLVAGRIHRRAKAKSEARRLLTEAESQFTAFGATAWRAQAAAELARVNVRPSAPTDLTETERRVAELAASGLTNREVADQLFLAVKTVEANLARAYRKLGIRSRAELGARMGTTP